MATMMVDTPALAPEVRYYQRLLARDESEAAEIIEAYVKSGGAASPFDALLVPGLNYAERDRLEGRLSPEEECAVVELTRDLIGDAAALMEARDDETAAGAVPERAATAMVPVMAYAANAEADVLALQMLEHMVRRLPVTLEITSSRMLAAEMVRIVRDRGYRIVCIADLPPSPPSKTRYLIRKLRAAVPDIKIVVGRWAPPDLADGDGGALRDAGADFVGVTLEETRQHLRELTMHGAAASPASAA
jgi:hypothetical protein